jgi:hypothetical protein
MTPFSLFSPRNTGKSAASSRRRRPATRRPGTRLSVEPLEDRTVPSTFLVTTTADSGPGSLRQAILDANAAGSGTILFNIAANDPHHYYYRDDGVIDQVSPGLIATTTASSDSAISDIDSDHPHSWWSIQPASSLDSLRVPITLDGWSQPGFAGARTPNIELDGSAISADIYGLLLDHVSNCVIRGLAINRFSGPYGIYRAAIGLNLANNCVFQGNFLGTDISGRIAEGNGNGTTDSATFYATGGYGNLIGTDGDGVNDAAERNLISGTREGAGIELGDSNDVVAGNYIGTDVTGTRALGNGFRGVYLTGDHIRVGTSGHEQDNAGERNVISGNGYWGIDIINSNNVIAGNFIGTDATGTHAIPNGGGISVSSPFYPANFNRIGTDSDGVGDADERNLISGNNGIGIYVSDYANDNLIAGNSVGLDANGLLLENLTDGIQIDPTSQRNRITRDLISASGGVGIHLDPGANNNQTSPVLTSVQGGSMTVVAGSLSSLPNTTFTLEFFAYASVGSQGPRFLSSALVTTNGAGSATFSVTFATPTYLGELITATATEEPAGNTSQFSAGAVITVIANTPPSLTGLSVTSPINEGGTAILSGAITDPDPLDTHTLVVNWGDGSAPQTVNIAAGGNPFPLTHQYLDNPVGQPNGTFPISLTVTDSLGASGTGSTSVQVNNVAPTVGAITAPLAPVQVGTAISTSAAFTDPGVLDTHTAVWSWGDSTTSAGTVTEANGSGTVAGSHAYAADGVYTVTLTVTDKDGGVGTSTFQYVVSYNQSAGFVTGGGWITSPAGSFMANPSLTGKATFGFNAKYKSGATVPTGNTEFQFPAANLNFHATSYDWLVITTNQAQYQGSGTINGSGNYGFLVTAQDNGGTTPDELRLQIWDKSNNNTVVYDTQPGAPTTAAPTTPLGGGRIQVHTNAQLVAGGENPTGANVAPLTAAELRPVVQEAIARWAAAGIDPARLSVLSQVAVGIAEFPGPWLGMAFPGAIWIDQNAAGYGWYLPTPTDGSDFPAAPGSPAYGKVDLLTVVEHELGHELGFGDTPGGGLMGVFLPTGTRRLPAALGGAEGKADLPPLFAIPPASVGVGMASEMPLPGPVQDTRSGDATPTSPGIWSLTFMPTALNLTTGMYTLFAETEDSYGVLEDPFALHLEVQ